ncbi:hypothetical protein QAD02_023776 [Eretmocerus hayati]|uniref:Uncharacterized protein n=1 Tax=Eretmocerus hayati TaxID=131215 RepID=A0ACC2PWT0_9HYME|nr:hypothetical protein QAD02_023776 [Eretmocerus hayati]
MGLDSFADDLDSLTSSMNESLHNFEGPVIIGGDSNPTIGIENQSDADILSETEFYATRHSKEPVLNKQGRQLVRDFETLGLTVLNGRTRTPEITTNDVNQLDSALIEAIKYSAKGLGLTKSIPHGEHALRDEPWFDNDCRSAYKNKGKFSTLGQELDEAASRLNLCPSNRWCALSLAK